MLPSLLQAAPDEAPAPVETQVPDSPPKTRPARSTKPRERYSPPEGRTRGMIKVQQAGHLPESEVVDETGPGPLDFPCKTELVTELDLSPAGRKLVEEGVQMFQLDPEMLAGIELEVAKIRRDWNIFAEGHQAEFKGAERNGIFQRGGLVCPMLMRRLFAKGCPLLSRLLVAMHLLNEQNALNFDYNGDNEMRDLFQLRASLVKANSWSSSLPAGGPKANGRQVAVVKFHMMQLIKDLEPEMQGQDAEQPTEEGVDVEPEEEEETELSEEEQEPKKKLRTVKHFDGIGCGKCRSSISLLSEVCKRLGSAGSFLLQEPRYDDDDLLLGVAEVTVPLAHGTLYSAHTTVRTYNKQEIVHCRDMRDFETDATLLNVMLEHPPGCLREYCAALTECLAYLNKVEYEIAENYEDYTAPPGWWGRAQDGGMAPQLEFMVPSNQRGLLYASVPAALIHENLDLSKSAWRCLKKMTRVKHADEYGIDHRCDECSVRPGGSSLVMRMHHCPTLSHECDLIEITGAEASGMTSEEVMKKFGFNRLRETHKFLAEHGVFMTSDHMKINDEHGRYSCKETSELVRQHLERTGQVDRADGKAKTKMLTWVTR